MPKPTTLLKPLTSSIYTFADMRETNTLYVDKTAFIYRLVSKPKGAFFLARPRRFGKSLTLSTLEAVFTGRRELFKGLAIDKLDYDWKTYPIIHLDMSLCAGDTVGAVSELLLERLDECAKKANVTLTGKTPVSRFNSLITAIAERGTPVVILIDEYDKPILEELDNLREAKKIRKLLRRFYGVAKATQRLQRFLFITGVASLAKVSFFSDLNHVSDISRERSYATMLGYTEEELKANFREYLLLAAKNENLSFDKFMEKFRRWYNGFCFHSAEPTIYNPVSVAKFFENSMEFKSFWFETGTSKQIIEIAQKKGFNFSKDVIPSITEDAFSQFDLDAIETLPLLVQSGYLTIKGAEDDFLGGKIYQLGFPNFEVASGFERFLLGSYIPKVKSEITTHATRLRTALIAEKHETTIEIINSLLAQIPGKLHVPLEAYYQSVVFTAIHFSGLDIRSEEWVAGGIIDNTVTLGNLLYIFEFKNRGKAAAAIKQIRENNYAAKFLGTEKKVILFGITFNTAKKCVADYKTEEL